MSAPEARTARPGLKLARFEADVVEVSAFVAGASDARRRIAGIELPACGHVVHAPSLLVLSVRPGRWLFISPVSAAGAAAQHWSAAAGGQGTVVDLSSALSCVLLCGARAREVLARGCRLDLDPALFVPGCAAATLMAQVAVTLAALPAGMLLLSPASTARHFREWLIATARPFGIAPEVNVSFSEACGAGAL